MQVSLLIIGDEILNGDTKDTNSHFAAGLLRDNGMPPARILTVGDRAEDIRAGLDFLFQTADLIVSTGGLGPTKDDITKNVIAEYFGSALTFSEEVYHTLSERFAKRGKTINELNRQQAVVPSLAEVIQNPVGTAPIFWMERNGKTLVCLPGVPGEMRFLLENELIPRIRARFNLSAVAQKTIHLIGIPESDLAEELMEVEDEISAANCNGEQYKLSYLPELGTLRLQINACGPDKNRLEHQLEHFKDRIDLKAHKYIYAYDKDNFFSYIGRLLKDRDAKIATAESCTGGYLAHLITSVTGSAEYYIGSTIAYSYEVKEQELGVRKETLENCGAVSEETLKEMLDGALKKFGCNYVVATTGIAGPTGGIEGKPIGTVWIGVASEYRTMTKKYLFDRSRLENIHLFAITALDMLRKLILGYEIE
jgi:nicotinamide-nucleotide amidase